MSNSVLSHRLPTIKLCLSRSTPGTHVYTEEQPEPQKQTFPTIYIKRSRFQGQTPPSAIFVTVEFDKVEG